MPKKQTADTASRVAPPQETRAAIAAAMTLGADKWHKVKVELEMDHHEMVAVAKIAKRHNVPFDEALSDLLGDARAGSDFWNCVFSIADGDEDKKEQAA